MYCSKCGVQNSDASTHCANCGGVLMDVAPEQPVAVPVTVVEPKTCGLAIASLVMGILTLFCSLFMAIPAIICGITALVKIGKSNGQLKGNGFAIAGIAVPAVLSLVVVPLMLAILMPALSKTKMIAQRVVCGTNLKGLSVAMMVYSNDYDGKLPTENWCDLFIEEVDVSPKSFVCPDSDAIEGESCYAMNKNIAGMNIDKLPPNTVLLFETEKGREDGPRNFPLENRRYYTFLNPSKIVIDENTKVYKERFNQFGGREDVVLRHSYSNDSSSYSGQPACNIVFADGHTELVPEAEIAGLQWTVE